MNSLYNYQNNETVLNNCDSHVTHPIPGKALLKSRNITFTLSNITFIDPNTSFQTFNRPIATLKIDTTCLTRPKLIINFTGILTVTPITGVAFLTFTFTLFKRCKSTIAPQSLATFSISYVNFLNSFPDSRTLNFEYSPCADEYEACCTYIMELTNISENLITDLTADLSFNGTFSALAIESSC